jgi:WD40 repeat protein
MKLSNWQQFLAAFAVVFVIAFVSLGVDWKPRPPPTSYMEAPGIHTPHEVRRISLGNEINAVAFNPDGSLLAVISYWGSEVTVFDTSTWDTKASFSRGKVGYSGNSLALLPDGSLLFTATPTAFVVPRNRRLAPDFGFGPSERYALEKRNISEPDQVDHLPHLAGVTTAEVQGLHTGYIFATSADGRLVAASNVSGVPVFDTRTGALLKLLVISEGEVLRPTRVTSLAFSADKKLLAVGTIFGSIQLYDTTSWTVLRTIPSDAEKDYRIAALAFSPDGRLLAAGRSKDLNLSNPSAAGVELWRVEDGGKIADLVAGTYQLRGKTNEAAVFSLAWSGDYLAVGDEITFHLWHIANGKTTPLIESSMRYGTLSLAFSSRGLLAAAENRDLVVYQ